MKTNLILGTAGHIDHGKTSLVRALTGTNTDRLPEEKKRGITIELGYAVLEIDEFRLGIVDVPGHEKFVRQMLSGATGMDLALLVVAADDSIKRQTIEHLDILRLLNLPGGVIAITKSDLVEAEWLELVTDEVRQLVAGTFLAESAIVAVSSHKGTGLDSLRDELKKVATRIQTSGGLSDPAAPFRLAIDRVFSIEGHGTVVTGSVSSGSVSVGDKLVIQPGGLEARVREIQNHDLAVQTIARGQRGAINLAGVHHDQIRRGQELGAIGHLKPTRIVSASLATLKSCSRPLKDRQRIRFHIGTSEVLATVRLMGKRELEPGSEGLAQFFLSEPIVAVWNQPFVIRNESPLETIGGGRILHASARRLRDFDEETATMLARLASDDPRSRISAAFYFDSLSNAELDDLARIAGVAQQESIVKELVGEGEIIEIPVTAHKTLYLHRLMITRVSNSIVEYLRRFHESDPLSVGARRKTLENYFAYLDSSKIFELALQELSANKRIQKSGSLIALEGCGPQLTANERKLLAQIVEQFEKSGLEPPTIEQLQKDASKARNSVVQLVQLAVDQGQLVRLDDSILVHSQTIDRIKQELSNSLSGKQGITMSDIRQLLNTSRKYAIPLCEYLDKVGFTRRDGDLRYLAAQEVSADHNTVQ